MYGLIVICLCIASVRAQVVPFRDLSPRIVNGEKAAKGQFPWQAAIYTEQQSGNPNLCGGALIGEEWVLTAGHCVVDSIKFTIALGSTTLSGDDPDRVVIATEDYILHENYSSLNLANDVALLLLPVPLNYSDTVKPIALSDRSIAAGTAVTISGWGLTSDSDDGASQDLNFVNLVTISEDECSAMYGRSLNYGTICAQENGSVVQSTCEGDSGGPLVNYDDPDEPVHVGIVSFGHPDGCESGKPSGYTETSAFRDWILNKTGI